MNSILKLSIFIGLIFISVTNLYAKSLVEISFAWDELNTLFGSNISYKINIALEWMPADKLQAFVPQIKKLYISSLKQSTSQWYREELAHLYYYIYIKSKYLSENINSNIKENSFIQYINPLYREFSIGQSNEDYINACKQISFNENEKSSYESCKSTTYLQWYFTVEENIHTDNIRFVTTSNKIFKLTEWISINKILNEWKSDTNFFMPINEIDENDTLKRTFNIDKFYSKVLEKWTYSIWIPILSDSDNEIILDMQVNWKNIPLSKVKVYDNESLKIDITTWKIVEQLNGNIDKYHSSFPLNFTVDWNWEIPFYLELPQYGQQEFEWDIVLKKDGEFIKKAKLSQNPWYRARDTDKNNIATFTSTQLSTGEYTIEWNIKIHSELNGISFTMKVWETNY